MLKLLLKNKIPTRIALILTYFSFYLVQVNIYGSAAGGTTCFFNDYYSAVNSPAQRSQAVKNAHNETYKTFCRLNKKFHPSVFFVPEAFTVDSVTPVCDLNESSALCDQARNQYDFNSPAHRGPPSLI